MTMTPLGSVSGMPKHGQAGSGYVVEHSETTILLDAGAGAALELSRRISPSDLDAIFISHMHIDHVYDVLAIAKMVLAPSLRKDPATGDIIAAPERRIPVFVPKGGAEQLHRHAATFPVRSHSVLDRAFEIAVELIEYSAGDRFTVGSLDLQTVGLAHVVPNSGVRISTDNAVLAYTGDTGVTDALATLAAGADLLLAECTYDEPDTSSHGHLCAEDAGRAAVSGRAKRLMLTHFLTADAASRAQHRDRAAAVYDGDVSIAVPGQSVVIG
ncbi:MBL fold metallo-hydrolase [Mycetocola sp.]|uniref:MBL fold metallo-hydrolase n=1 Tax=Mycetocola sp. TaxID=1871042 RepID=UPI003989184F